MARRRKLQACGVANLGHHRDAYILERDPYLLARTFRRPRPVVALLAILGCGLQITFQLFQGLKVQHGLPIYSIEVRETDDPVLYCDPSHFMYDETFKADEGVWRQHV